MEFLENERSEHEAYVLHCKSKRKNLEKTSGGGNEDKLDNKGGDAKSYVAEPIADDSANQRQNEVVHQPKCFVCGKSEDHVVTTDSNNKRVIDYFACKVFADKKPKERGNLLYKKRLCKKCLKPGAKYNSDHECNEKYVCNQDFKKGDQDLKCKNHVLVCGFHCDNACTGACGQ